jgi:glycerate 2-kinase
MSRSQPLLSAEERSRRERLDGILAAALEAVDPAEAIRRAVSREGEVLHIGQRTYRLADYERIFVVGGGKAGAPMAAAVEEMIGARLTAGLVNVKHGHTLSQAGKVEINEAGHPTPDEAGRTGVQRMVDMLADLSEKDLVICLISGGGSALLPLPVAGISLEEMQALTGSLLRCGATINEINAVRKHISQIKGGQLARLAYPADLVSLILSDVVGNPLDVIASGPTVPDTSTFATAYEVLERYDILDEVADSIVARLKAGQAGQVPETPKEGEEIFKKTYNLIIGSNEVAAQAAIATAQELGFNVLFLSTYVEGEAREVAKVFAAVAKEIVRYGRPLSRPACVVAGGETTVTITGAGMGGRNQELALAAALALEGWDDTILVSLATDGTDGPTDAAGAIASGSTLSRAESLGLSAEKYLADNDSYHFFEQLGDLIMTGPTNTNVNDLIFVFVFD